MLLLYLTLSCVAFANCAENVIRYYGGYYSFNIRRKAEYLEFIPLHSVDLPKVLWNRSDPATNTGGRGQLKRNEWKMENLNQDDNGHYKIRGKEKDVMSWVWLEVKATMNYYEAMEDEMLVIHYPFPDTPWTVTFKPKGENQEKIILKPVKRYGSDHWTLPHRTQLWDYGIEINPVELSDSGTFEFRDPEGHLAKIGDVVVLEKTDNTFVNVGVAVGIFFALLVGCCCVKKCCCKKSSSKGVETAPPTAAGLGSYNPAVNQPTGQNYTARPATSYSYQPYSLPPREPTAEPPVYNPVNVHVSPLQPEDAPPGGQGVDRTSTLGSDFLSSDPGPRFELRLTSPFPLSAESNFPHVYTSDKLKFLQEAQ
ncbi:hypothetical protein PBY51_016051 [Eleginops maclovinus]|uniref:Uncharacterized protein n=1 Tax=Eleginops maclovinus TaxID=56733 RepID=A0AAN7XQ58_ELEMC|nr:hypothetical protein PBY51_016051 [Eleginops maclovinus]